MKRFSYILTAIIFLLLLVFTFYGDDIYKLTTPHASVVTVNGYITVNDTSYLQLPASALLQDRYVYTVTSKEGFSKTLYTIHKTEVTYLTMPDLDQTTLSITSGIRHGEMVLSNPSEAASLKEGDQIIPK